VGLRPAVVIGIPRLARNDKAGRACSIHRSLIAVIVLLCALLPAEAQKKNPPPSLTQIQSALKRDPRNPHLHVALGLAYWDQNDYPHALEAFQEAVKVAPGSAEAHNWLGVALMGKADLPGAVAELRKAVSLDPKYPRAYTNLGSALVKSGELAEAVNAFSKALALQPNPTTRMNLGLALREKGDTAEALVHLRRVARAQRRPCLHSLGQVQYPRAEAGRLPRRHHRAAAR